MYINGLFLLLFWCLGWSELGFVNGLYLVAILLVALLLSYTRRKAAFSLIAFLLASAGQYDLIYSQFPYPWAGKDLRINACVSAVKSTRTGLSLLLSNVQVDVPIVVEGKKRVKPVYKAGSHLLPGKVKVSIYPYTNAAQPQLKNLDQSLGLAGLIGQKIELIVRLKGANNYHNPQSYDYIRWSQLEGQAASGYVKKWLVTKGTCSGINWPMLLLEQLRQRLWQGLQSYTEIRGMSLESVGLWGALVLGQTSALTSQQWQVLAATGTTHLLVISGLHVGLVAVLVMLLMRLLLLPFGIRSTLGLKLGAWVGVVSAIGFALLSGFGLPAQRAVIMLAGLMWGSMWGLQLSFTQRIFMAFFVTLVLQPISAASLGFWLSYTAVFALGLVWYSSTNQRWWQRVIRLLAAQGALSVLLVPVIALGTGYVSLVGPLVNIFLVPLFSVLLIPALLGISVASSFMVLPQFFFTGIDLTLSFLWQGLEILAGLTWSQVFVGWLPLAGFVSALMVGCICLVIRRWHWPILFLLMPFVVFIMFKALSTNNPKSLDNIQPQVVVTLLDVGQGLSVWVRQGEHNMLYDVGNRYGSGFNLVDAVILPEMLAQGVRQLDVLVISHWDMDHSGGLHTLLRQQTVKRLILPSERKAKREKGLVRTLTKAAATTKKTATMKVNRCVSSPWENLWQDSSPPLMWRQIALADYGLTGNNASCVILLNIYGRQVLIAGDIEAKAEGFLIAAASELGTIGTSLASDVLIAPHHGSKTSSTEKFLTHVRPAYVLVSAGKRNSYGHPHDQITNAYWRHGSHWYNTGRNGQIRVVFETDGTYEVTPYLP
jgi:competence protein ComEC